MEPDRHARIVTAPWVVPIATPPVRDGAVIVDADGTVVAVGKRADLRTRFAAAAELRAEGALLPGLVNAHLHLELSWLASPVPGGAGLVAWTGQVVTRPRPAPDDVTAAARAAVHAVAACGTAAIGDVGNGLHAIAALAEARLHGVFFHELLGSRDAQTGDALADAAAERAAFSASCPWPERLRYVAAPHAPYSVGPALLRRIFALAAAGGHATSIHVAEDPDEIALLVDGGGRWPPILQRLGVPPGDRTPHLRPLPYLHAAGAFAGARPPLLVHMVHADEEDRRLAAAQGATAVLCPRSNLHIGGRLPDVPALLRDGVALALGTDSLASVPDLSLWNEISTLARAFPQIDATCWLRAATQSGAHALGLPLLGAITEGSRPGLLDVAAAAPLPDDAAALVAALVRSPPRLVRWMVRP